MSKGKQTTLFQSWGSTKQNKPCPSQSVSRELAEEDEDILIARAMEESLKDLEQTGRSVAAGASSSVGQDMKNEFSEDSSDIYENMPLCDIPEATAIEDLPGFDKTAGNLWIYPTNYPVREYQFSIVKEALYQNTMVVLPTGLGKTFIAAVVMYNFYRWYPQGKIVFMAPTKPLVAQQIEACYNIMGIPQEDTAEMTGAMNPAERKRSWSRKRVFFLTPQVLVNDLSRSACPAELIKCLVVDEAHKATGNHAYCQVVRELIKYNQQFRILSLSATPGSDIKAVQQVLSNLLISHIELKSEESPDIRQYSHERKVDKVVVPLGQELAQVKDKYLQIMTVVVNRLKRLGVLYNRDAKSLSKFLILKARESFRQDPPPNMQRSQFGMVEGDFALAMSLYHGYDLLQQHGLRSLHNYLDGILHGDKAYGRTKTELMKNADFRELVDMLTGKFQPVKCAHPDALTPSQFSPMRASQLAKPFAVGHPKMDKLREIVLEHFKKYKNDGLETRIMIFSQFRDSVNEITEILNRHRPLVKVMSFIGQSSMGKSSKGFTQKDQLRVMKQFREGGYNTLVSTCVGEEGLDIGDVDLIICFDAHKSPIRLVQRMGRTGRKRQGRIVMLVTEGKEEQIYNQSQYSKKSIHKAIQNGAKSLHFYQDNPRMVPLGLTPGVHKMHITVHTQYNAQAAKGKATTTAPQKNQMTSMLQTRNTRSKTKTVEKKDGFLTAQELEYWHEKFRIDEKTVPSLPESHFSSLPTKHPGKTETTQKPGAGRSTLSLSNWMPWQNRLQDTKQSGHSLRSNHLVQLMEFMDIQNSVESSGDHYGMEMQMYLNEEDIIRPEQSNSVGKGILKYCTTQAKDGKKVVEKRRPSAVLPGFSSEEEVIGSDEELPGLQDLMRPVKDDKQTEKCVSGHPSPVKKKSLSQDRSHDQSVSHDKPPSNNKKVKRKNNHSRSKKDVSVITIIDNQGSEDFENDFGDNGESFLENADVIENSSSNCVQSELTISETVPQMPSLVNIEEGMEIVDVLEAENNGELVDIKTTNTDGGELNFKNETSINIVDEQEEIRLSQLLPDFTRKAGKPNSGDTFSEVKTTKHSTAVRTPPPPIEEVNRIMGELDRKGCLSPVDVLDLIDKWEFEKSVHIQNTEGNGMISDYTSTVDAGSQTRTRGDSVQARSAEDSEQDIDAGDSSVYAREMSSPATAKMSVAKSSISINPLVERSRVDTVKTQIQGLNMCQNSDVQLCDELDVKINRKGRCIDEVRNTKSVSPLKSQVVKKPLFKKTPSPSSCAQVKVVLHDKPRTNSNKGVMETSLFEGVGTHNFSLPLTDELADKNVPFETYRGDTDCVQSENNQEQCRPRNQDGDTDFVKASHLLVSPRINRNNSCSSEEYSPTFDAPHSCSLATSTPAVVKSSNMFKICDQLQDSFFNQDDDALFENIKTPFQPVLGDEKVTPKSSLVQTSHQDFKGTDKQQRFKSFNKSLNSTQITFTQALAFADESLNSSHSRTTTESSRSFTEVTLANSRTNYKPTSEHVTDVQGQNKILCKLHNQQSEQNINGEKNPLKKEAFEKVYDQVKSESSKAEVTMENEDDYGPHFDLGFDFDDELDEVVPPSPVKSTQPFSQVTMLSKTGTSNMTVEQSNTDSGVNTSPALIGGLGAKFSQKVPESSTSSDVIDKNSNKINIFTEHGNGCCDDDDSDFADNANFAEVLGELMDKTDKSLESNSSHENTSLSILTPMPKLSGSSKLHEKQSTGMKETTSVHQEIISECSKVTRSTESAPSGDDSSILLLKKKRRTEPLKNSFIREQISNQPMKSPVSNDLASHSESDDNDSLLLVPKLSNIDAVEKKHKSAFQTESIQQFSTQVGRVQPQRQTNNRPSASLVGTQENMGNRVDKNNSKVKNVEHAVNVEDSETLEVTAGDFEESLNYGMKSPRSTGNVSEVTNHIMGRRSDMFPQVEATGGSIFRNGDFEDGINEGRLQELDDSIIQVKRKKKSVAIIASPDTPGVRRTSCLDDSEFKTPLKPAPRAKRARIVLSSDEEEETSTSPYMVKASKRRRTLTLDQHGFSDSDDGDFEDFRQESKSVTYSKRNEKRTEKEYKRKKKKGCGFIEEEAELSGDPDDSSDEDGSDLDQLDDSFVNDATQLTQGVADSDMHAVYMRSITSPGGEGSAMPERYRLKPVPGLNVFSQVPYEEEGESCYMEDSFVVGSDHEFGESEFVYDQTIMEAAILPTSRRRHTRNSNRNHVIPATKTDRKLTKDRTRKRIRRIQHGSSSSEEEGDRNVTVTENKWKKSRISSSESEASFTAEKSPELVNSKPDRMLNTSSSMISSGKSCIKSPGFTQIPSLQSRCRQRMNNNVCKTSSIDSENSLRKVSMKQTDESKQQLDEKALLKEKCVLSKISECKIEEINEDLNEADFDLTFDLGLDDLMEEDIEKKEENNTSYKESKRSVDISISSKVSSHVTLHTSISTHSVSGRYNRNTSDSVVSNNVLISTNLQSKCTNDSKQKKLTQNNILQGDGRESHVTHSSRTKTSTFSSPTNSNISSSQNTSGLCSPTKLTLSKEDRLRISRLKQEEFKKKYARKMESSGKPPSDNVTILDHTLPTEPKKHGMYSSPAPSNMLSNITQTRDAASQSLIVFVDSREINGAQDVISVLRAKHHYHTEITQLQACDYIISHRMAVERKVISDFTNGANKAKLVDRLKQMKELFEKCVLLVEKDRIKPGEKESTKSMFKSKYVEVMLASLCQMQVKVYFSESQENSADVLSQLIDIEQRKGFGVLQRKPLSQPQTRLLKFYLSIPKVSHITALNFLYGYVTLRDFVNSPIGILEKKGQISREKAGEIHRYMQHQFDQQMLVYKR